MNTPDSPDEDKPIADLLAAAGRDSPPPDRAFLDTLRNRSTDAFRAASAPLSLRKRIMLHSSFRWVAACAAAVLVLGIVVAQWVKTVNQPNPGPDPDDKFVAANGLVDDGRIGKVTDAQGVVAVKPILAERWSPVQPRLVLKPGDWLRTDSRGANAVALRLLKSVAAIVGPHSTVELIQSTQIRLIAGEIELTATDADPVELHGPDKQVVKVTGKQHFRVQNEKLVKVEQEPLWLQGFKGTTANESIGSLVASIDGRDVPLTVGYHHVTVDIRDQIARTTIEESFVNRTKTDLEGMFHFPLPQDASISGFGMWIGDKLVEADVVEKQRAREIYETILREKRDPGLLEWAGGNIFKARVFPISAFSEKRIKITYTQVLPLQGNRFRYSYALQSELLKAHPLRDLKIDVKVNSAVPLKAVSSPTHAARVSKTDNSGHVEFTAQEYTPARDFEAVVEVAGRQSDVVMIPHRRGDDGYFLVQLTPPGAGGDWDRPLVPNGDPLKLLILADTSASMDRQQRTAQRAVIASLLGSLTPKDVVDLAACDVGCDWAFPKPSPATPENLAAIDQLLAKRSSLGWTDLDTAFTSALAMCEPGTHVVYVGDGIVTTGDADPVAFAKRVQKLHQGKPGTFHAIAIGSSFEPLALKAIASLGGGSFRRVSGEKGPQAAALELLTEIAAPTLRDLKVEFVGLQTARVYPESLPNVAAGTQQILLGRYLPAGKDQAGEVVVTGTLGGKPVRFASKVSLADAEAGNSFIPRLWARMHLDKLLEQGTSDVVKQDIIGLSEEFNIITPYTSLLVLETDADRERFAVKRRFQMRDGERFFATGRDNATYELKQRQMTRAGSYRTELRRGVLAHLATFGRNAQLFSPQPRKYDRRLGASYAGRSTRDFLSLGESDSLERLGDGVEGFFDVPDGRVMSFDGVEFGFATSLGIRDGDELGKGLADEMNRSTMMYDMPGNQPKAERFGGLSGERGLNLADEFDESRFDGSKLAALEPFGGTMLGRPFSKARIAPDEYQDSRGQAGLNWFGSLFPPLAGPPAAPKEPKTSWPADAIALSRSLLRMEALGRVKGGIVITRQSDSFDARRNELSARSRRLELVSPTAWFARTTPDGGQVIASWCDGKEIGTFTTAFQLGRVRPSTALDLQAPLELVDHSTAALHVAFAKYTASVEALDKDRSLLILKHRGSPDAEVRYLIDTTRRVLLSVEHRHKGKVTTATRFDDFVEVAGSWWARRTETRNDKGERTALTTQTVAEVPADEFAKTMADELAGKAKVVFLGPLPKLADAKAAVAAGKATFDDRAALVLHFAATQQWARAREHLDAAEKLAAGKAGMRWLSSAFLLAGRRHEELRKRLLEDAAAHANTADPDALANDHFLAEYLFRQAQQVCQTNEQLAIADTLRTNADRQPAHLQAVKAWRSRRVGLLQQAGQPDKSIALQKELATEYPRDTYLQHQYAQQLVSAGDFPAAYAWLTRSLEAKRDPTEVVSLRDLFAGLLQQQGRYRELADYLAESIKIDTESEHAHAFYLSSLVRSNQAARAETLAAEWIAAAVAAGEVTSALTARLHAALRFALGDGYQLSANRVEEKWHAPLAAAALHFARRTDTLRTAGLIVTHHRYGSTDAAQTIRKTLADILLNDVATLTVAQIDQFVMWAFNDIARPEREKLIAGIRKRWDAEMNPDTKHQLAQPLGRLLYHFDDDAYRAFLRVQYATAADEYRATYANQLFGALTSQPWDAAREDEAFTLLDKLAETDDAAEALLNRVAALHRFTDAMLEARYQARVKTIEHPEKLPRPELQKKHDELRKHVREAFAARLRAEAAKHPKPFAEWLTAELIWIEMLLERDPKLVATDCWAILDVPAPKADDPLDAALRARILTVLENLATRKGADAALVARVLQHIDAQKERGEKYRMLIALDRAADLERELRLWLAGPDPENRWRLALGYLLAEQGKVADAIKEFEQVEAADELTPAAYRALTDWYLVENRRQAHEKARAATFKTSPEYQLGQRINVYLNPWRATSGRLPTQLDPDVLLTFQVLFEKSATPPQYLWQLQLFYQASRDFRLLSMLPDGVVGHTAGKVYPFVQGMSGVLGEIRDEATADELLKRVEDVRKLAKTVVDQRALDMLELLVERRAAELQNQPGPHAANALAAMQRAFGREWSPGEPRLMAAFLASLGAMSQPTLAVEQLKQLEALHRHVAAGSFDRLQIAADYAETLHRYSRAADATDRLAAAVKEFETASGGVLPVSANTALDRLVSFTESAGHYDRGEKVLLAQLTHPVHAEQKRWLERRLYTLYKAALGGDGETSLGKGEALYKKLEKKLHNDLATPDQNQRYQLVEILCGVYRTAHSHRIGDAPADVKAFAFTTFPPMLRDQVNDYDSAVRNVASLVWFVCDARDAIAFVLDRADTEPDWRRYVGQDTWTQFHTQLGEWRAQTKDLGDVEPRLLKFLVAELKRDLISQQSRGRTLYSRQHNYYWPEKVEAFAAAAEEVLAGRKTSSSAVEYIAGYLYSDLQRETRAIDVLFAAYEQRVLGDGAVWHLTGFLHQKGRFAESIPLLVPLVAKYPENFDYRRRLMHAYFQTGKQAELLALLKDTDAYFHDKDRWSEGPLAGLAASTLENKLFAQSATYHEELIPLHQRSQPRGGVGNGTLSNYYQQAARAYAGLGNTKKAVDMASGAVVSWGPSQGQRAYAIDTLVEVLAAAPDLGAFAADLDKEKLQSAVVRKAVGKAYIRKADHARAIPHLILAAELQPDDADTQKTLLECFDKVGDGEKAIAQLLSAAETSRRDIQLFADLGSRFAMLNHPADAERAYTSVVEMLPNETESHTLLAEVREKQGRWRDAIGHWERVAALRSLEPTGLLKLGAAQVQAKDWDAAAATVKKLRGQSWPPRFHELPKQLGELEKRLESRPR